MPASIIIGQGAGLSSGGAGGGNASVGLNGATAPTSSTELGIIVAGLLQPISATNPLPITGTIVASNPSVGATGVAAPAFATEIGVINSGGLLEGASASNPVRIDPTGTTIQPISGTITALQGTSPWVVSGTVTVTPSGLQNVNVTQWDTTALGAPSAYGTSPGAVNVIGVNAFVTNPVAVTNTGTFAVQITGTPAENITQWGSVAVAAATATSTAGTDSAPIVRNTQRKYGQILTTTPLGSSATYTSVWFDTNATGGAYVSFSWASNVIGANGILIQETDDSTNASIPIYTVFSATASASGTIVGVITRRYWRVVYPNGATAQSTFEIAVTESDIPPDVQAFTPTTVALAGVPYMMGGTTTSDVMVASGLPMTSAGNIVTNAALPVASFVMNGDGASSFGGQNFAALRTPAVFKTVSVPATASGNTAVWTPAAGKKFRLMRFQVSGVNLGATAATVITISFQDATTGITIGTYDILLPATATSTAVLVGGNPTISNWVDLGNGYLSVAANNVLNANVSATVAGATGSFRYNVCGTEE